MSVQQPPGADLTDQPVAPSGIYMLSYYSNIPLSNRAGKRGDLVFAAADGVAAAWCMEPLRCGRLHQA